MISEEWREVKECSYLLISNLGRVWNSKKKRFSNPDKVYVPGRGNLRPSFLLKETWKWEWIKELHDDEEVRRIRGFPSYFITTHGRVWSEKSYSWLEGTPGFGYYVMVQLWKEGKSCYTSLSTLVGRNFLDWEEGLFVLHKEETLPHPEINFLENLWLGTLGDNNTDRHQKGRTRGFCGEEGVGTLDWGN